MTWNGFRLKTSRMDNIYDNPPFFAAYAEMPRSRQGLAAAGEWHQFKNLFPDLKDKSVLDLGCGYGWHCNYAVERGAARVLGIDSSENMIREAKRLHSDPKISYEVEGVESYVYPEHTFDCVISNLVFHYIENLEEIYRKVYRTLKAGGTFLFNIEHPVFTSGVGQEWIYDAEGNPQHWPVDRYFDTGERLTRFLGHTVVKQHHTLTQILSGLLNAGFQIEAVEEAMPSTEMLALPGMRNELKRPMMLLVKARKMPVSCC